MIPVIEILVGLVIGVVGFFRMADGPVEGAFTLLLAGFLIMAVIEKLLSSTKPDNR